MFYWAVFWFVLAVIAAVFAYAGFPYLVAVIAKVVLAFSTCFAIAGFAIGRRPKKNSPLG